MKRTLSLALAAASLCAPIGARAGQSVTPAAPLLSQLATSSARFTILDSEGHVAGFLAAAPGGTLELRRIGGANALDAQTPRSNRTDAARALTVQQQDEAARAAYDAFFGIERGP